MALLPPPDIGTAYVDDINRPSKDFYNWIKSLYDYTRTLTGGGGGGGSPGGAVSNVQYNAGGGNFGGYSNTQVTALLDLFTSSLKGIVPASGGGSTNFLRADGSWTSPGGSGAPGGSNLQIQYNNLGSFGGYTGTQVTALLDLFTSSLRGVVPSSGGGSTNFLRADGTWAAPSGTGSPGGSNLQVQYNNAGAFAGYTNTQLTALLNVFTSTLKGVAPPSGGGTTNFLRADGGWAAPPGTGGGSSVRVQRSVTSGPITPVGTDEILNINIASPTGVTLPAASTRGGKALTFKDVGSHAAANNITLTPSGAETIDGAATFVMRNNRQAITLNPFNDGVNSGWFLT